MAKQPVRRKAGVAKRKATAKKLTTKREQATKLDKEAHRLERPANYQKPSKGSAYIAKLARSKAKQLRGTGKSTGGRSK